MGDDFYIFSLRWTREDYATWWCPNNSGYTSCLEQAGRYSRADVERNPGYYNNGETTIAIPCAEVDAVSQRVVFNYAFRKLIGKRLVTVVDGGNEECPDCGQPSASYNLGLRVAGDSK